MKKKKKGPERTVLDILTKFEAPNKRCYTCAQFPETVKELDIVLLQWVNLGHRTATWSALYRALKELTGYTLSRKALMRHVSECRSELYEKIRNTPWVVKKAE